MEGSDDVYEEGVHGGIIFFDKSSFGIFVGLKVLLDIGLLGETKVGPDDV